MAKPTEKPADDDMQQRYENAAKLLVSDISGLSLREAEERTGLDRTTISEIRKEVRTSQYSQKRYPGTVRDIEKYVRSRQDAAEKSAVDHRMWQALEQIDRDYAPLERHLARETLAAVLRARTADREAEAAIAAEHAAAIRARAAYLAEKRASLICRGGGPDGNGGGARDEQPPEASPTPPS